jgi:cation/acetate symporter
VASVGLILFSPTAWELYGLTPADAPFPLKNPGIISIPLSFIAIYIVSKLTKPDMMDEQTLGRPSPEPSAERVAAKVSNAE